jgi:predicted negative regulator of RcsB-dependent stress response
VDRITRKELKQDKFAVEVTHTVDFLAEHRAQAIRYGIAGVVVVVLLVGFFTWRSHEAAARRAALSAVLELRQAPVGPPQGDPLIRSFPTEQEKTKALVAAFSDVALKYSGKEEGTIAEFYLGTMAADQGNLPGAEKALTEVIDSGDANYASLARLSLAEIYQSEGKTSDGEKLLRSAVEKPSSFVSKEQAILALARYLAPTKPAEARKLLEPLRAVPRSAVSRAALAELESLPK